MRCPPPGSRERGMSGVGGEGAEQEAGRRDQVKKSPGWLGRGMEAGWGWLSGRLLERRWNY